jgi:hypothetical protein
MQNELPGKGASFSRTVCAWVTPVPSSFAPHGVVEEFPAARVANLKAPGVPLRRLAFEL